MLKMCDHCSRKRHACIPIPYECIPLANRVLKHFLRREEAEAHNDEARSIRQQQNLERL